jgi:hypothetical protein
MTGSRSNQPSNGQLKTFRLVPKSAELNAHGSRLTRTGRCAFPELGVCPEVTCLVLAAFQAECAFQETDSKYWRGMRFIHPLWGRFLETTNSRCHEPASGICSRRSCVGRPDQRRVLSMLDGLRLGIDGVTTPLRDRSLSIRTIVGLHSPRASA